MHVYVPCSNMYAHPKSSKSSSSDGSLNSFWYIRLLVVRTSSRETETTLLRGCARGTRPAAKSTREFEREPKGLVRPDEPECELEGESKSEAVDTESEGTKSSMTLGLLEIERNVAHHCTHVQFGTLEFTAPESRTFADETVSANLDA